MAVFTASAASLRSLKNTLLDQFPSIKSSHISEALACALGFNTNIALSTKLASMPSGLTTFLGEPRFFDRLAQLGYTNLSQFSFDQILAGAGLPADFASWLTRIASLQKQQPDNTEELYELQDKCKAAFGKYWDLGYPSPVELQHPMLASYARGVVHSKVQAGWGETLRSLGLLMNFPGTDHPVTYHDRLPLSDGRYVEYTTALVSMPYIDSSTNMALLPKARAIAETLGWESHVLPDWTWYAPPFDGSLTGTTTLVLFRRKESRETTRQMWDTSFKRWVFENFERLRDDGYSIRDAAISEVIESAHFPLDVQSFEELDEKYLAEFVQTAYLWKPNVVSRGLQELFSVWGAER